MARTANQNIINRKKMSRIHSDPFFIRELIDLTP